MNRPACEIVSAILFLSEKGPSERMSLTETTQTTTWHAGQDPNSNTVGRTRSESQLRTGERLQRWFITDPFQKNTDCSRQRAPFTKKVAHPLHRSLLHANSEPKPADETWTSQAQEARCCQDWLIRNKRYTSRDGWAVTVDRRASFSMSSRLFSTHGRFKQAVRHAFGFPSTELHDNLCYF